MSTHRSYPELGPKSDAVTGARALQQAKNRRERGQFIVDGPSGVAAALDAGIAVSIYAVNPADDLVRDAERAGVRVYIVTEAGFAAISETVTPQGIAAVCRIPSHELDDVLANIRSHVVVCSEIADPGNLGTIIRTAAASGADAVITTAGSADAWSAKVIRSTAGTFAALPVFASLPDSVVIDALSSNGIAVLSMAGESSQELGSAEVSDLLAQKHAWIVGNEAHGLASMWLDQATARIRIPMAPGIESLNAASAAAICLYSTVLSRHSS